MPSTVSVAYHWRGA